MALYPQSVWGINVSQLLRERLSVPLAAEKTAQLAGLMRAIETDDIFEYLETLGEDVFDADGEPNEKGERIYEEFENGIDCSGFVLRFFGDTLKEYLPYISEAMMMEFHYVPGDAFVNEVDVETEDVILGLGLSVFPLTDRERNRIPLGFRNIACWFSWVIGV